MGSANSEEIESIPLCMWHKGHNTKGHSVGVTKMSREEQGGDKLYKPVVLFLKKRRKKTKKKLCSILVFKAVFGPLGYRSQCCLHVLWLNSAEMKPLA